MKQPEIEKSYYENQGLWQPLAFDQREHDRIEFTFKMLPLDITSLADVGCGNGLFLKYAQENFSERSLKLIGVDTSKAALQHVHGEKVLGSINKLPLGDSAWDVVTALEMLEHLTVAEYESGLQELSRVAKRYILISVPYDQNLRDGLRECPMCKTRFHSAHHKRSFNERTMQSLFDSLGYKNIKISKFGWDLESYVTTDATKLYRLIKPLSAKPSSPCPMCGYVVNSTTLISTGSKQSSSLLPRLRRYIPKRGKSRWIFGLYKKIEQ